MKTSTVYSVQLMEYLNSLNVKGRAIQSQECCPKNKGVQHLTRRVCFRENHLVHCNLERVHAQSGHIVGFPRLLVGLSEKCNGTTSINNSPSTSSSVLEKCRSCMFYAAVVRVLCLQKYSQAPREIPISPMADGGADPEKILLTGLSRAYVEKKS